MISANFIHSIGFQYPCYNPSTSTIILLTLLFLIHTIICPTSFRTTAQILPTTTIPLLTTVPTLHPVTQTTQIPFQTKIPTKIPISNIDNYNNLPGSPDPTEIRVISAKTLKHPGIKPTIINEENSGTTTHSVIDAQLFLMILGVAVIIGFNI